MSNSDNPRNGAIFQQQVKNWFQNHFETSFELEKKNGLSLKEIASSLNGYGITADRKTLYSDFEQLRRFGVDIISQQKGRDLLYCVCSRQFELPELKLLVDSVQSAKFLTERKSNELIKKLEDHFGKESAEKHVTELENDPKRKSV